MFPRRKESVVYNNNTNGDKEKPAGQVGPQEEEQQLLHHLQPITTE
jgi:hypothetical protein